MTDYSQSREKMIDALVSEVFGPEVIKQPIGTPIDTTKEINFTSEDKAKKYHPYYDQNSNQEILTTERPTQKYGAGVLYPFQQADLATHVNNTSTIDSFTLLFPRNDPPKLAISPSASEIFEGITILSPFNSPLYPFK